VTGGRCGRQHPVRSRDGNRAGGRGSADGVDLDRDQDGIGPGQSGPAGPFRGRRFGAARAFPVPAQGRPSGTSTGDYPRGYTVTTSTDGVNWSTAVASGAGTGQFTAVPLAGAPVRYVRITLTASSGSWFSVADVRAYTAGSGH
jgi:hypothetical protein